VTGWDSRSGACFNCGRPGHIAADCPARLAPQQAPKARALDDGEIEARITRFYQPAGPLEMTGLVATWRRDYKPGLEYPEAPRYPPGFLSLLRARQAAHAN
jgi:Zinc knuckle